MLDEGGSNIAMCNGLEGCDGMRKMYRKSLDFTATAYYQPSEPLTACSFAFATRQKIHFVFAIYSSGHIMYSREPDKKCEHKMSIYILRTKGESRSMFCECICPPVVFFAYLLCRDNPPHLKHFHLNCNQKTTKKQPTIFLRPLTQSEGRKKHMSLFRSKGITRIMLSPAK